MVSEAKIIQDHDESPHLVPGNQICSKPYIILLLWWTGAYQMLKVWFESEFHRNIFQIFISNQTNETVHGITKYHTNMLVIILYM